MKRDLPDLVSFCQKIQDDATKFIEAFEAALARFDAEHDACVRLGGQHEWEVQAEFSGRRMTRYKCKRCEAWGYRVWPRSGRKKLPPIIAYKHGFDSEKYRERVAGDEEDRREALKARDRHQSEEEP